MSDKEAVNDINETISDEELVEAYKNGQVKAFNELCLRYRRLVKFIARAYYLIGGDDEDLEQEGLIGLFNAVVVYNGTSSFKSFAYRCINNNILSFIKKASRNKHKPLNSYVSLDGADGEKVNGCDNPETIFIDKAEIEEALNNIKSKLSKFELKVFELYMEGCSRNEICEQVGKNYKAVDNTILRIKHKAQEC